MEIPQRRSSRPSAIIGRLASTADHSSCEKVWPVRQYIPHARASHGISRYIDTALIDMKLSTQPIDDFQSQSCAVSETWKLLRRLLRKVVSDPSSIGLRRQYVTGETLLIFRKQPHPRAEPVAET